jgi:ATP-dependent DNA ligase
VQRRKRLGEIITPVPSIQVGGYMEKHGTNLLQLTKEKGLEGNYCEAKEEPYLANSRQRQAGQTSS